MRQRPPVDHQFQNKSKFALLTVNNVYTDLPPAKFQLSDGTWIMPGVPVPDLGVWREWIGSLRMGRLGGANLVPFVEELSDKGSCLARESAALAEELTALEEYPPQARCHPLPVARLRCSSAILLPGSETASCSLGVKRKVRGASTAEGRGAGGGSPSNCDRIERER